MPYLHCKDAVALAEWYTRVFGFVERKRWEGKDGKVHNLDMTVGDTEVWLDGGAGRKADQWIGVWVDDVDATYERVCAAGAEPDGPPEDKPYGVRAFNVRDPEGYLWGFMRRIQA